MFLVLIIVHSLIRNISLQPIRDHSELDRRVNVSTCTFVPLNQLNLELPREKNTIIVTLTSRCRLGTPFVSGFEPVKQVIWYHFPVQVPIFFFSFFFKQTQKAQKDGLSTRMDRLGVCEFSLDNWTSPRGS